MIGSAATSMATMLLREVNISPPTSEILDSNTQELSSGFTDDEIIVEVAFKLKIGELVDSSIMQVLPIETAKKISSIMMGVQTGDSSEPAPKKEEAPATVKETIKPEQQQISYEEPVPKETIQYVEQREEQVNHPPVEVQKASFQPLQQSQVYSAPKNIDLIMDVPLDISVVLGRTKKNIKEILNLGTGSLIELDRLAEEPVEILVNGKKVAYGEVVVVDENFGVRITSIISNEERVKSLGR